MPRNMSFALTTKQIRKRTKTVTRRLGWANLKAGDRFWAVEKVRGLKKGEKVKRIALLECVDNQPEQLDCMFVWGYGVAEAKLEGFPKLTGPQFVAMFCKAMGVGPDQVVNRIEFIYVDEGDKPCDSPRTNTTRRSRR